MAKSKKKKAFSGKHVHEDKYANKERQGANFKVKKVNTDQPYQGSVIIDSDRAAVIQRRDEYLRRRTSLLRVFLS